MPMRVILYYLAASLVLAGLIGCGSSAATDSDPPPGVRKNEKPNAGVIHPKRGKPAVVGAGKKAP
jgi:hypothetical protein